MKKFVLSFVALVASACGINFEAGSNLDNIATVEAIDSLSVSKFLEFRRIDSGEYCVRKNDSLGYKSQYYGPFAGDELPGLLSEFSLAEQVVGGTIFFGLLPAGFYLSSAALVESLRSARLLPWSQLGNIPKTALKVGLASGFLMVPILIATTKNRVYEQVSIAKAGSLEVAVVEQDTFEKQYENIIKKGLNRRGCYD